MVYKRRCVCRRNVFYETFRSDNHLVNLLNLFICHKVFCYNFLRFIRFWCTKGIPESTLLCERNRCHSWTLFRAYTFQKLLPFKYTRNEEKKISRTCVEHLSVFPNLSVLCGFVNAYCWTFNTLGDTCSPEKLHR